MTGRPHSLEMGIVVHDMEVMTRFYEEGLGCSRIADQARGVGLMRRFACGDAQIKLIQMNKKPDGLTAPGGAGGGVAGLRWFSLAIEGDLAEVLERCVACGANVVVPVSGTYPGGPNYFVVEDPEQNRFEVLDGVLSYEAVQAMSR
ncbi:VOC family protein [Streptomyces chartreusis]|uniref:VOC family protein n=1 Tax=Streptomyces chartreusis TaxID=1969 RepID=UPI003636A303